MINNKFSVIFPVYKKVKFKTFFKSFESLLNQTLLPNEILVVLDGPVKGSIINYLNEKSKKFNSIKILNFPVNQGLGHALKIATKLCKYDYVARCDADDISSEERFQTQINFLSKNNNIDVLGSNVYEIENNKIVSKKNVKNLHAEIKKGFFLRNPINHSSVIFKKKKILDSGNYEDVKFFEDYFLWIKVLLNGGKFHNLSSYLVKMEVDNDFFKRRSGINYLKSYLFFLKKLSSRKLISTYYLIINYLLRFIIILMPIIVLKKIYKIFLRN